MGILKVGVGALKSVLEDSWREYFYCPAMEPDVLVKKGENRKSNRSYNTKNSDNLISNGSIIAVNEGQCMMIVDQGAIVEVCGSRRVCVRYLPQAEYFLRKSRKEHRGQL